MALYKKCVNCTVRIAQLGALCVPCYQHQKYMERVTQRIQTNPADAQKASAAGISAAVKLRDGGFFDQVTFGAVHRAFLGVSMQLAATLNTDRLMNEAIRADEAYAEQMLADGGIEAVSPLEAQNILNRMEEESPEYIARAMAHNKRIASQVRRMQDEAMKKLPFATGKQDSGEPTGQAGNQDSEPTAA